MLLDRPGADHHCRSARRRRFDDGGVQHQPSARSDGRTGDGRSVQRRVAVSRAVPADARRSHLVRGLPRHLGGAKAMMTCPSGFGRLDFGQYMHMGISPLRRPLQALLMVFAVVLAMVAPATSVAAPADIAAAAAAVEPAVVQITTKIDYQHAIGTGT